MWCSHCGKLSKLCRFLWLLGFLLWGYRTSSGIRAKSSRLTPKPIPILHIALLFFIAFFWCISCILWWWVWRMGRRLNCHPCQGSIRCFWRFRWCSLVFSVLWWWCLNFTSTMSSSLWTISRGGHLCIGLYQPLLMISSCLWSLCPLFRSAYPSVMVLFALIRRYYLCLLYHSEISVPCWSHPSSPQ